MRAQIKKLECNYCDSIFELSYDDEEVSNGVHHCPFCGDEIEVEEEELWETEA